MTASRLVRRFIVCFALVLLLPFGSKAQVAPFDSFYGFGDSLADVGNVFVGSGGTVPPSISPHAAYFQGRFSSGPVAYEYLWQLLTGHAPGSPQGVRPSLLVPVLPPAGAVDFAFGVTGTGVLDPLPGGLFAPGLQGQVEGFRTQLAGASPSEHALYAIFTGANDYLSPLIHRSINEVVANIANSVAELYDLGARDVIVLDLPDLGLGPAVPASSRAQLSELTRAHNKLLKVTLHQLSAQLKGLNVIEIDPNDVFRHDLPDGINMTVPVLDVFYPPELFGSSGFRMSQCIAIDPTTCRDVPTFSAPGYLFWDYSHPTTEIHRLFAQVIYDAMKL